MTKTVCVCFFLGFLFPTRPRTFCALFSRFGALFHSANCVPKLSHVHTSRLLSVCALFYAAAKSQSNLFQIYNRGEALHHNLGRCADGEWRATQKKIHPFRNSWTFFKCVRRFLFVFCIMVHGWIKPVSIYYCILFFFSFFLYFNRDLTIIARFETFVRRCRNGPCNAARESNHRRRLLIGTGHVNLLICSAGKHIQTHKQTHTHT